MPKSSPDTDQGEFDPKHFGSSMGRPTCMLDRLNAFFSYSFAWLEKNGRLWKNCERLLNTNLQFSPFSIGRLVK